MNTRAVSEDPNQLVKPGYCLLPQNGFRWIHGVHGGKDGTASDNDFLERIPGPQRLIPVASEVDIEFAATETTPAALIGFANKHGALGLPRIHFHLPNDLLRQKRGEAISRWRYEQKDFSRWFQIWSLVRDGDGPALSRIVNSDDYFNEFPEREQSGKQLVECMSSRLVSQINREMKAEGYVPPAGCFVGTCPRNQNTHQGVSYELGGVTYALEYSRQKTRSIILSKVQPERLLSAIWLRFAEAVSGERIYRRCEAEDCDFKWIDVTGRKGTKRMHDRCSIRRRMQRYRRKGRNA